MLSCGLCCTLSDGEELEMVNPDVVPAGPVLLGAPSLVKQTAACAAQAEDGSKDILAILPGLETEGTVVVVGAENAENTDQLAGDAARAASLLETMRASTGGSELTETVASPQPEGSEIVSDPLSATASWSWGTEVVGLRLRFKVPAVVVRITTSLGKISQQEETAEVVVRNKPLGVHFNKCMVQCTSTSCGMAARVAQVVPGAGQLAGIGEGWVLTHIEDKEVPEDFDTFHAALLRALQDLPSASLVLNFRLPSGSETAIQRMHVPLGFVFGKRLPVVVKEVHARSMGFLTGAQLVSFGGRAVADYSDFDSFIKDLQQASSTLPKRRSVGSSSRVSCTASASSNSSRTSGSSSAS